MIIEIQRSRISNFIQMIGDHNHLLRVPVLSPLIFHFNHSTSFDSSKSFLLIHLDRSFPCPCADVPRCPNPFAYSNFYRTVLCIARTMQSQDVDVRPSVCLSVTHRYAIETAKRVIKTFSPSGSHTTSVFSDGDP